MVFGVDQFNGVVQIYPRPTLVAMATKFYDKIGYNSALVRDTFEIVGSSMGFSGSGS